MVKWHHAVPQIWVNICSGNGLLPDGNKPLPEPMLTYHQSGPETFTWGQFTRDTWAINYYNRLENHLRFHSSLPGVNEFTHWPLGDPNKILDNQFQNKFQWLMARASVEKQSSNECYRTLEMISQHWSRWWLGAIRQQAITWANADSELCCHIASLGHNELRKPSAYNSMWLK